MESILQWGLDVIRAIQIVHGPVLDTIMKIITFLCNQLFLILMIPVFYWCVDFKLGVRLLNIIILSNYSSSGLKAIFAQPRPFHLDPAVKLQDEVNYGLPSSHSQNAVAVWGTLAISFRKKWLWIVAVSLMILIGFSRIYLGVHFPTDVFAGWFLGIVTLLVFHKLAPAVEKLFTRIHLLFRLLIVIALTVLALLVFFHEDSIALMALFLGGNCGAILIDRLAPFKPQASFTKRLLCYVIGVCGIFGIYFGLQLLFPKEGETFYVALRFFRYVLLSFWITFGAPLVFLKLKLARVAGEPANP